MKIFYGLLLILPLCTATAGPPDWNGDSAQTVKKIPTHWRLSTRLHNMGMFTYGGRVACVNPAADISFTLERPKWGLLFFKGMDLKDHNTFYNFALLTVFKNFRISRNITFTPYVGTFLEQSHSLADHGSDVACILITNFKLTPHVQLEHMSLFGNLVVDPTDRDWVNRFRLVIAHKHLDAIPTFWYNSPVFDHSSYLTAGLNLAWSRMKVADHLFLSTGITGLVVVHTSNEAVNPRKNGLMLTLGLQYAR